MGENTFLHIDEAMVEKVNETMPPEEEMQDLAEFFKVFGDATRLKILYVFDYDCDYNYIRHHYMNN